MKKKSITIFITILLMLGIIAATVYAVKKIDASDTDIPVKPPAKTETIPVETPTQIETLPIEVHVQTETVPVKTHVQTEALPVETPTQTETLPIETSEQDESLSGRIDGTYYCHSNGLYIPHLGKHFDEKWHTEHPDYVPTITFNRDGSFIFRIYYGAGMADVGGIYSIEGNTILLDCELEGSFFEGLDDQGLPYMDDRYILEIVDYDHLTFNVVPDAVFKSGCYAIRPGDSFIRK